MTDPKSIAADCLQASSDGSLSFPQIVQRLIAAGFESYTIDFRCDTATYYQADGQSYVLPFSGETGPVAAAFQTNLIKDAIAEAQSGNTDYSYRGFCRKVKQAGCAGYLVSFLGRRAIYFGRTGETHVELFPS